ncbi:unnamed protein product [Prorocentrum cordatum]|uniref:Uncharacterized protein n=1 Tax=Prorocentrum cordatum TaxID=2364126 RepID=A0ABN9VPY0_9DINO|nr:unnamed protein product [Polarella glacialis]
MTAQSLGQASKLPSCIQLLGRWLYNCPSASLPSLSGFNYASKNASVTPSSEILPIFVIDSMWQPAWETNWSTCRAAYARDSPRRRWTDNGVGGRNLTQEVCA